MVKGAPASCFRARRMAVPGSPGEKVVVQRDQRCGCLGRSEVCSLWFALLTRRRAASTGAEVLDETAASVERCWKSQVKFAEVPLCGTPQLLGADRCGSPTGCLRPWLLLGACNDGVGEALSSRA